MKDWFTTGKVLISTKHVRLTVAPAVWFFVAGMIAMAIWLPTK